MYCLEAPDVFSYPSGSYIITYLIQGDFALNLVEGANVGSITSYLIEGANGICTIISFLGKGASYLYFFEVSNASTTTLEPSPKGKETALAHVDRVESPVLVPARVLHSVIVSLPPELPALPTKIASLVDMTHGWSSAVKQHTNSSSRLPKPSDVIRKDTHQLRLCFDSSKKQELFLSTWNEYQVPLLRLILDLPTLTFLLSIPDPLTLTLMLCDCDSDSAKVPRSSKKLVVCTIIRSHDLFKPDAAAGSVPTEPGPGPGYAVIPLISFPIPVPAEPPAGPDDRKLTLNGRFAIIEALCEDQNESYVNEGDFCPFASLLNVLKEGIVDRDEDKDDEEEEEGKGEGKEEEAGAGEGEETEAGFGVRLEVGVGVSVELDRGEGIEVIEGIELSELSGWGRGCLCDARSDADTESDSESGLAAAGMYGDVDGTRDCACNCGEAVVVVVVVVDVDVNGENGGARGNGAGGRGGWYICMAQWIEERMKILVPQVEAYVGKL
ncbi:hypothetical protein EV360DRAFT_66495 [Lentinula raphanica]|nr:hypothetical protein EV360DRAFT_66495 [Lentinula raphanica]